ncbi:hypothetical protein K0U83_23655 [bacterium]|nr:hypothetical protein [bacterium]
MIAPHHPEEIRRLADICYILFDADVFISCRRREYVDARVVFSALLHEQGMGPSAIGEVLGRNHATIIHYLRKFEALLETDKVFRKKYVKCREQYIGKDPIFYYSAPELRRKFMDMRDELTRTKARLAKAEEEIAVERRLQPIIHMVRIRTKRGQEEEVANKINRMYNGL